MIGGEIPFTRRPQAKGEVEDVRACPSPHSSRRCSLRQAAARNAAAATEPADQVRHRRNYRVGELESEGWALSLGERPANSRTTLPVPDSFYGSGAAERAQRQTRSARGELEITGLDHSSYSDEETQPMGRGVAWFDTGTLEKLLAASDLIEEIETRQELIAGVLEEVLDRERLRADSIPRSPSCDNLEEIVDTE